MVQWLKWFIVQNLEGSVPGQIEVLLQHLTRGVEENYNETIPDSQCPGRNSNTAPPEQKYRALLLRRGARIGKVPTTVHLQVSSRIFTSHQIISKG
jgi:hypothetical protein